MKILKIIGIIIVVLVVAVLIAGLIAPKKFEVSRFTLIKSSPEIVFKNISTFEQFGKWNPWNKYDSNQVVKIEGNDGAVGVKRTWKGNSTVGEGAMTITKIEPNTSVGFALDFIKPFEAHNTAYLYMEESDRGGQKVTWSMKGEMKYPMNAMLLIMDMDKEGGKDFEEGLANLKALCEKP